MTFTLTINGESPAELLTALQQLNSSPAPQPQSEPVAQPDKPKAPAPAKQKKAAQKPVAAPEKQAAQEERVSPTTAPAQDAGAAATTDAPAAGLPERASETPTTQADANAAASLNKIRDLARTLIVHGKRAEVQQIIKDTGAASISKLPPDSYTDVWEQLVNLSSEVDDHAAD